MKILGHFEELWLERAGTPDGKLQDFTRAGREPDEDRIVQYLRDGEELFSAMGTVTDILGSDERILGGDSVFTDCEWIWRGDLWFYLSRYHVRLPEEFLVRVREQGYKLPVADEAWLISQSDELLEFSDAVEELDSRRRRSWTAYPISRDSQRHSSRFRTHSSLAGLRGLV